jgi:isoleucyl-tRNA synthetase
MVDYAEDMRLSQEILDRNAEAYRKIRNTFRYLLGALDGFEESERIDVAEMPELERYMLALTAELDARLRKAVDDYDFNDYTRALSDFCNNDLSAFFFDIRKDSLYCDAPTDLKRRAYRTVLDTLFHALVRWASPVLVFTSEEVWGTRYPGAGSVHLLEWPLIDQQWREDDALERKWSHVRELRELVTEAIEPLRRDKTIGSSLEATVSIRVKDALLAERAQSVDLAEICIVSAVSVTGFVDDSISETRLIDVGRTTNHKCGRCWRLLPEVTEDGGLCARCEDVVNG